MRTRHPQSGGAQGVDSRYNTRRSGAPHAQGNTAMQLVDDHKPEVRGQRKLAKDPCNNQHNPGTPTTGLRERRNDTSRSTRGRSNRQNAATRHSTQREERVTVQGPYRNSNPTECHTGG